MLHKIFKMLFPNILNIFLILFQFQSIQTLENCSNSNEPIPTMVEYIYGLGTLPDRFPFESFKRITSDDISGYLQRIIQCSDTSPIEVVVNTNHPEDFDIFRNLIQIKNTPTGFQYSITFVFLYTSVNPKHPVIFSCQKINAYRNCRPKVFWEVTPPNAFISSARFKTTLTPSNEAFQALVHKVDSRLNQESPCGVTLIVKQVENNKIEYKWKRDNNIGDFNQILKSTDSPTYFHGVYRHLSMNQSCVKLLNEEEPCDKCELFVDTGVKQTAQTNGVIFYANISSREYVFKGAFNISRKPGGPRQFYVEQDVPLDEMMYFEPPLIFYVNQTTIVTCSVSLLYFSHGAIITDQMEIAGEIPIDEQEYFKEDGRREVSLTLTYSTGNFTSTLYCRSHLYNFSKKIEKSQQVFIEYPEAPSFIATDSLEVLVVNEREKGHRISCQASGKPLPSIKWTFPTSNISEKLNISFVQESEGIIKSEIVFSAITNQFIGTYTCLATNCLGTISKPFTIKIPSGVSSKTKVLIGTGLGSITLFCGIILFIMYGRMKSRELEYKIKREAVIQGFLNGEKTEVINNDHNTSQHPHMEIYEKPYNNRYEVPFEKWVIEEKFLGEGQFGVVKKGQVLIGDKTVQIAIKMMKSSVENDDLSGFLAELKVMAYIGAHTNVARLIAACTENINQHGVLIGVEYCENGSLFEYLIKHRSESVVRNLADGGGDINMKSTNEAGAIYSNCLTVEKLSLEQCYIWSYQIANGMDFLGSKKVLHGDLAVRNILLTIDKTAKISDFGLSRFLLESSNYTKKSEIPVPWRHMALESFKTKKFSSSTDVWAYGMTLWEIFSLGEMPYPGRHLSIGFIEALEVGLRPLKPKKATDFTYGIMKDCWKENPSERPTFSELKVVFIKILAKIKNPKLRFVPEQTQIIRRKPIPQPRTSGPATYSNIHVKGKIIPNVYSNI